MRIGLLLYPNCLPAGLFAAMDLLHAANLRAGKALFEPFFVAARAGKVECAHGQQLRAAIALDEAGVDALMVPGFWGQSLGQATRTLDANAGLVTMLAALPRRVQLWAYCTGVCLAAGSGRLDRQAATITWWLAEFAATNFGKVRWQFERTLAFNERNATASGVNGYLPIVQALIEDRLGKEAYRELTRLMVLPRPEEKTHLAFHLLDLIEQQDTLLRKLHLVVEQLDAGDATLARVAHLLHTTERTLARKVLAASSMPAAAYIRRIKLKQVSERLIYTRASATAISLELGFSSDSGMRRMFKDLTGFTPAQYRTNFSR
ncbi:GlxA family transcriptional regulator [Pseudoduganella sp. S-14]|jgi:transcriptional regulator GlxA family with amidase domain|uniref:GlxA family transcriptional regulator n=1 Tax=Pseudoduganella sp. S-14 TaxID=3404065 RepID=UPI003CFACB46